MSSANESTGNVPARISRRQILQVTALGGAAAVGISQLSHFTSAQDNATPTGLSTLPTNLSVVTDGLQNPRSLVIADNGTIYISEGGLLDSELVLATPIAGTPVPVEAVAIRGETGLVTALAPDFSKTIIAEGLPATLLGTDLNGPAGLALIDGALLLVTGGAGPEQPNVMPHPNENSLLRIDLVTGAITNLANIGAFEIASNPNGYAIASNCADLLVLDGVAYISDAGGNTIYAVDLATNELRVVVVVPGIPGTEPNPARQNNPEIDPVPTGLALSPDGMILVGLHSGPPYTPGSAAILKLALDGTISNWAGGLSMVGAIATAPDGTVYATQQSSDFLTSPEGTGSIVRLSVDGASELVLDGLSKPTGLAVDAAGNLYVIVSAFGSNSGGVLLKISDPGSLTDVRLATPEAPTVATPEIPAAATPSPVVSSNTVTIETQDILFSPSTIDIAAGADVTITIRNSGFIPHDFRIDSPLIQSGIIASGAEVSLVINLPAGSYTFYCTVRGHKQAGMIGVLRAV